MATSIRFFGVAGYELVTERGQHVLVDPFLDDNPGAPCRSEDLGPVDLICVSHAASDHLGDTEAIARRTGAPVVCGGEVRAYLMAKGVPAEQVRATVWGIAVQVAGVVVQPVECHHWSQIRMPDGTFASGVPMGFVIHLADDVRFYHYGDTAIFSDLKLIGQLYRPTIGAVGIANPIEIESRNPMPGVMITSEMSPLEGVLAAQWLGLDTVLPCHYINPDNDDVRAFERHLEQARGRGERVPESLVLRPGDVITPRAGARLG
jgi:L-ascorbate metabolism protein UlaG (beta-lactamase superfamily)